MLAKGPAWVVQCRANLLKEWTGWAFELEVDFWLKCLLKLSTRKNFSFEPRVLNRFRLKEARTGVLRRWA